MASNPQASERGMASTRATGFDVITTGATGVGWSALSPTIPPESHDTRPVPSRWRRLDLWSRRIKLRACSASHPIGLPMRRRAG